jgi:hypothetical protein
VVSAWGLEWFGVVVQVVLTVWAIALFVLWRRATLRVDSELVRVGGPVREQEVPWSDVSSFSIRDPVERTLFVWMLRPAQTYGRLNLRDGSSIRLRAVQPWPGNWTYDRPEGADRLIDALNAYRAARQSATNPAT